jgi:mRNA interferase MazF
MDVVVPISDKFDSNGNKILDGYVLLGNITTVSKARLGDFINELEKCEMAKINEVIAKSTDIYFLFQKYEKQIAGKQKHIDNLERDKAKLEEQVKNLELEINLLKKQ